MEWTLLEGAPEVARRRLLASARRRRFGRGEVVFHEGDLGDTLHLIAVGCFAVRVVTTGGDRATLSLLGPGDFFGILALLNEEDRRRTAGIRAIDPGETLAITKHDLDLFRDAHPRVDGVLLQALGLQVRRLSDALVEALYTPADARVLRRLLDAAVMWGGPDAGTVVPLTQEELAQLAGTTRATTNQVLRQASRLGLVAIGRGKVTLVDPVALARRAGVHPVTGAHAGSRAH